MPAIGVSVGVGHRRRGFRPLALFDALASTSLPAWLSHSRAGNATMFDSTGKLTYAPNNLLLNTETLSTQSVNLAANTNYILTYYGTGSVALSGTASGTPSGTNPSYVKFASSGAGSATFTVTGSVTNASLAAVTYETTPRAQDQVITTAAAYYGPRIDYDPNTLAVKGLLIEEARTNLALQSQNFTNAAWTRSGATVSSPSATAPDGTATAQKLVENAGTVNPQVFNTSVFTVTNGANYSWTVFFKAAERSWGVVNAYDSAGHRTYFNLNTGTIGTNAAGNTASIQAVGNGWYRCQVSRAITGTSAYAQFEISSADNTPTYTGDGTSGVYIWGAQFEAGAYATSYIPTTSPSVTRTADSLAAASYSSNPAIVQYRSQSTGTRARKKLTTFSNISSETAEWIEAIRVYPVGTSSAYLDAHLTVDGAW